MPPYLPTPRLPTTYLPTPTLIGVRGVEPRFTGHEKFVCATRVWGAPTVWGAAPGAPPWPYLCVLVCVCGCLVVRRVERNASSGPSAKGTRRTALIPDFLPRCGGRAPASGAIFPRIHEFRDEHRPKRPVRVKNARGPTAAACGVQPHAALPFVLRDGASTPVI